MTVRAHLTDNDPIHNPKLAHTLSSDEDWVRLPVRPRERYQGLARATILELVDAGHVKSAVLRKPGSKRSIRLISRSSLLRYLESCVEKP
jgi:hypothetical protein